MSSFFKKVLSILLGCFIFYCVIYCIIELGPFFVGVAAVTIAIVVLLTKILKKTAAKKRNENVADEIYKTTSTDTNAEKNKPAENKRKTKKTDMSANYCKKCGKEVNKNNIYCFNCGHKID